MFYLLPTACLICQRYQSQSICKVCAKELVSQSLSRCKQCAHPLEADMTCIACKRMAFAFDETWCLDNYDSAWAKAVQSLKYTKQIAYDTGLAKAWFMGHQNSINTLQGLNSIAVPVPLSQQKLAQRGFNQSWEILKKIGRLTDVPCDAHILHRKHSSLNQAQASRIERLQQSDLFHIEPQFANQLNQRTVIVFDDVMTTGATLHQIAKLLKSHGAQRVINWVLLRTTTHDSSRTRRT